MLRMTQFMNQSLPWLIRSTTKDEYNVYTYSSSTLTCRVTYKRDLFRNSNGEELLSNAIIHTEQDIKEGDKVTIDGVNWSIQAIRPYVNKAGVTIGLKGVI